MKYISGFEKEKLAIDLRCDIKQFRRNNVSCLKVVERCPGIAVALPAHSPETRQRCILLCSSLTIDLFDRWQYFFDFGGNNKVASKKGGCNFAVGCDAAL